MAFLELKNIGKIYVSEGNVAVGIRGVDLAFNKGEFVAVTGESGSGKSTLLNVISGMDSYEEGEMLVEGRPTSHFLEPERERYREEYISFIFQDYNILDSFTVLQNVELALMASIPDPVKRRARAIELLKRVGLGDRLRQRGSKLSGGQKQRTVIARALAKDSPIILADEPTGNLDSESAKEIVALLAEVARDKLLIVVTHNISEVQGYATREVRVFDGAVVSDTGPAPAGTGAARSAASQADEGAAKAETAGGEASGSGNAGGTVPAVPAAPKKPGKPHSVRSGITLGRAMFSATPKLSIFLCLLMLLGSLGLLSVTASCGKVPEFLGKPTMFAPTKGRLVVTKADGSPLSDQEAERIADQSGAVRVLHYDYLLDAFQGDPDKNTVIPGLEGRYGLQPVCGEHFSEKIYGREPREENEALLYLPVSLKPSFGTEEHAETAIWCGLSYKVTGVQYYIDNNLTPKIVLTEDGFDCALTAYLLNGADQSVKVGFLKDGRLTGTQLLSSVVPLFGMPKDKVYVGSKTFTGSLDSRIAAGDVPQLQVSLSVFFRSNNGFLNQFLGRSQQAFRADLNMPGDIYLREKPEEMDGYVFSGKGDPLYLALSIDVLRAGMKDKLAEMYPQASLFFTSEKKAQAAAEMLRKDGYISSLSTAKYSPEVYETILSSSQGILLLLVWLLTVVFLAFFINLCSGKAVGAFRHDLAILRSMGIPVKTVVSGLFTRLYLSLIPAAAFVAALAFVLYRTPKGNAMLPYLYWWQYLLIFLGMVLIAARVGRKQVKKLFGTSVREALRGGEDA